MLRLQEGRCTDPPMLTPTTVPVSQAVVRTSSSQPRARHGQSPHSTGETESEKELGNPRVWDGEMDGEMGESSLPRAADQLSSLLADGASGMIVHATD